MAVGFGQDIIVFCLCARGGESRVFVGFSDLLLFLPCLAFLDHYYCLLVVLETMDRENIPRRCYPTVATGGWDAKPGSTM